MDHTCLHQPSASRRPRRRRRRCRSDGSSDSNLLSQLTMMSTTRSKRRKRERKASINSLPNELLVDILVRLPADFLHHIARLVCHTWSQIIRSNDFISTHFRRHSTYGVVQSLESSYSYKPCHSIYMMATQGGRIETSELMSYMSMAISCNGLSLKSPDREASGELYVVNPATKQSFRLPSVSTSCSHFYYSQCGMAYSAASMEYKVTLQVYSYTSPSPFALCLHIVSVGVDKSWRRVSLPERIRPEVFSSYPLTTEGFLHWGKGVYCVTMNVDTEMITMVKAPILPDQRKYSYYYLSTGRYITLFVRRRGRGELSWRVWEMRPAESRKWRKAVLPNIDLDPQKSKLRQEFDYDGKQRLVPVGWVKYPEILAFSGLTTWERTCMAYNLETHEINPIDFPHPLFRYGRAFVHRNTLTWLSQDRSE